MINYIGRHVRFSQEPEEILDQNGKPTGEWTKEWVYEGEVREQGWLDNNHTWNLLSQFADEIIQNYDESLYEGYDEKNIPREDTPCLYVYNDNDTPRQLPLQFYEAEFID